MCLDTSSLRRASIRGCCSEKTTPPRSARRRGRRRARRSSSGSAPSPAATARSSHYPGTFGDTIRGHHTVFHLSSLVCLGGRYNRGTPCHFPGVQAGDGGPLPLAAILPARIASDAAGVLGSPSEEIVRLRPLGSGSRPVRPGERKALRGPGAAGVADVAARPQTARPGRNGTRRPQMTPRPQRHIPAARGRDVPPAVPGAPGEGQVDADPHGEHRSRGRRVCQMRMFPPSRQRLATRWGCPGAYGTHARGTGPG
jgi:hypothetical protein